MKNLEELKAELDAAHAVFAAVLADISAYEASRDYADAHDAYLKALEAQENSND